jgi:hypothetical protein
MKAFIVLASSLVCLTLWGCKEDTLQPDKPKNTQDNQKATLYGSTNQWVFVGGYSNTKWDDKQSGVKVEVVGTNISTETDGYGEFKLKGLDSGTYSIRFSKNGFETVIIDSVRSNGKDSVRVVLTIKDSLGNKVDYKEVFLREITPKISIPKANASATEIIKIDTIKDHGKIREIRRDTSYWWQGEFSIDLKSDVKATQENLDAGYYIAITNSSTVEPSLLPTQFSDSQAEIKKGWIAYYGSSLKTKPVYTGTRDFVLNSTGKNADMNVALGSTIMNLKVTKQQQLYLHIIPVTVEKILRQKSNRFNTWLEFDGGYKLGEMKTIPIEWK